MSFWKRITGDDAPAYAIDTAKADLPALHAEMRRLSAQQDALKALRRELALRIEIKERQAPKGN